MVFQDFTDALDLSILKRVWGRRRHFGGILDTMESVLVEYEPERTHMDLVRTNFYEFCPKSGIWNACLVVGGLSSGWISVEWLDFTIVVGFLYSGGKLVSDCHSHVPAPQQSVPSTQSPKG